MKDTKSKVQSQEKEHTTGKQDAKKSSPLKNRGVLMAAALSQGTISQTPDRDLLEGLSTLGNLSFVQMLENREKNKNALRGYADNGTLKPDRIKPLKEKLAAGFANGMDKVNKVERIPIGEDRAPLPELLDKDTGNLSGLAPAHFEQMLTGVQESDSQGQYNIETGYGL